MSSPIGAIVTFDIEPACYIQDTEILCFDETTGYEFYKKVQDLKKGDFVKTKYHGYKPVIQTVSQTIPTYKNKITSQIWKMSKSKNPRLTKDLYLTGGHSIIVDELSPSEMEKQGAYFSVPEEIDNKLLLMAGFSDSFEKVKKTKKYRSYHFLLEPSGDNLRYIVWANGIESESTTPAAFNNH